jgi:hypothetical protein
MYLTQHCAVCIHHAQARHMQSCHVRNSFFECGFMADGVDGLCAFYRFDVGRDGAQ